MGSRETDIFIAKQNLSNGSSLANFMGYQQRFTLLSMLDGEEGLAIAELVQNAVKAIRNTPKTYETANVEIEDNVVHLHYFIGGVEAWIIERDIGDTLEDDGLGQQLQAFGYQSLFGLGFQGAEPGYVSIQDLIDNGAELDLYWTPVTVKELRSK